MQIDKDETFEEMLNRLGKIAQIQHIDGPSFILVALSQICKKLDSELSAKSKLIV